SIGFSSNKKEIVRPIVPTVSIAVNGKEIDLSDTPVRSTNANGIVGYDLYETTFTLPSGTMGIPKISANADNPDVQVSVTQAETAQGVTLVKFDYNGVVKTHRVVFASESHSVNI